MDTGPEFRAEDVLRLLRREGVNRLDVLVLTHSDAQHVGAARFLLRELPVGGLWIPAVLWPSPVMKETLETRRPPACPSAGCARENAGDWPGDMAWEVLWPPDPLEIARADEASLAMRVARYGVAILLAGDVGAEQETAMIAAASPSPRPVLLAGRHGDALATSADWLEDVRPREAIISAGPHSDARHPDVQTLERLAARGIQIWRTDLQGTIQVDLAGTPARWPDPGYRIRAAPVINGTWRRRAACARAGSSWGNRRTKGDPRLARHPRGQRITFARQADVPERGRLIGAHDGLDGVAIHGGFKIPQRLPVLAQARGQHGGLEEKGLVGRLVFQKLLQHVEGFLRPVELGQQRGLQAERGNIPGRWPDTVPAIDRLWPGCAP